MELQDGRRGDRLVAKALCLEELRLKLVRVRVCALELRFEGVALLVAQLQDCFQAHRERVLLLLESLDEFDETDAHEHHAAEAGLHQLREGVYRVGSGCGCRGRHCD